MLIHGIHGARRFTDLVASVLSTESQEAHAQSGFPNQALLADFCAL